MMKKAISATGGPVALAAECNVKYQAVQRWGRKGCPAERVISVERASGVPRHELRPDLYPTDLKAETQESAA